MRREEFDHITKDMISLEDGGVKKACFVVQEYLLHKDSIDPITEKSCCVVTEEEFYDAISILKAFSYKNSTNYTKAELYECTLGDSCLPTAPFCKGGFNANNHLAKKLCPYKFDPYKTPGEVMPYNRANL